MSDHHIFPIFLELVLIQKYTFDYLQNDSVTAQLLIVHSLHYNRIYEYISLLDSLI